MEIGEKAGVPDLESDPHDHETNTMSDKLLPEAAITKDQLKESITRDGRNTQVISIFEFSK
jgi:hypothetical protein